MFKMKILIMYARTYDIPAEPGRDAVKGCSVNYFFWGEHGESLQSKVYDANEAAGTQRAKVSLEFDKIAKMNSIPGIYEGEFNMSTGSDGKPVLKLIDIDYVADVNFQAYNPITGEILGSSVDLSTYQQEKKTK